MQVWGRFRIFAVACVALWGASTDVSLFAEGVPTGRVEEIRFEGLKRVDREALELVMSTRRGEPLTATAVAEDVRALYGMGYFRDVSVYAETMGEGLLRVVYQLVEKPAIRKVLIEGHDDISEEDVKEVVDIRPFTILDEAKVQRNVQKIQELYQGKGFYLAEVSHQIQELSESEVAVVFKIVENAKVEVRSVRLVGNRNISDETLKGGLATQEGDLLSFLSDSGTYKKDQFEIDILRIQGAYFDNGYINVRVDTPDVEISPDLRQVYITIHIEEGEQYSIGKIDFSGDLLEDKTQLAQKVLSTSGAIFNRSQLGQDLLALKTRYEDDGYAYANITPVTAIDAEKRIIDITFDIQKGKKVYYERINVVGNTKTRDKVIRRELRIYEGELTSATLREESRGRVVALGYFEKVDIKTRRGSTDELQIVDIEVKERGTGTFQVGAGFSSAENFIATAQIAEENFFGRGQSIALSAQISSLRQQFSLRFFEPYFFDSKWSFGFNLFNTENQLQSFSRSSTGGDLTLGHPLTDDRRLQTFLTYSLEFIRSAGTGQVFSNPAFAALNRTGRVSSIQLRATYDSRDNRLFASKGMFHSVSHEISSSYLGATENRAFHRTSGFARFYHPLIWSLVGKLSFRAGYIRSTSEQGLSPTEKFLMGGINSLRGYRLWTIGPNRRATYGGRGSESYDPSSSTLVFNEGGNKEFLFNGEIEFPIFAAVGIKGVVFVDAGNTYGEDENFFYLGGKAREQYLLNKTFDPTSLPLGLFWSTGFGFRWFSPIGPLRFEWGIPLTRRPSDSTGPQFEFSIGNSF